MCERLEPRSVGARQAASTTMIGHRSAPQRHNAPKGRRKSTASTTMIGQTVSPVMTQTAAGNGAARGATKHNKKHADRRETQAGETQKTRVSGRQKKTLLLVRRLRQQPVSGWRCKKARRRNIFQGDPQVGSKLAGRVGSGRVT